MNNSAVDQVTSETFVKNNMETKNQKLDKIVTSETSLENNLDTIKSNDFRYSPSIDKVAHETLGKNQLKPINNKSSKAESKTILDKQAGKLLYLELV